MLDINCFGDLCSVRLPERLVMGVGVIIMIGEPQPPPKAKFRIGTGSRTSRWKTFSCSRSKFVSVLPLSDKKHLTFATKKDRDTLKSQQPILSGRPAGP